jgi:general secretion pathway protein A
MRQLDQRISLRAKLTALSRDDVAAYIAHRLGVARGTATVAFDGGAVDAVFRVSGGIPRVINLLCDRALMQGAHAGAGIITAGLVEEAATALTLKAPAAVGWWRRLPWLRGRAQ